MKIFITGGAGYVGSRLVPELLRSGHSVTVFDLMIYGENVLDSHKNLRKIKGDIRDISLLEKNLEDHDAVIHLACISNDPSYELNPKLGKSINFDAFEPFLKLCVKKNIYRFIYASSSSVYGIKTEKNVTEDMSLEPLTDYSKFKGDCEKILNRYKSEDFVVTTIRPSTVCGYAKRQRLDLVVNILTNHAFHNKVIKVFGGNQLRPNIHIDDMVDSYKVVLKADPKKINGEIFNVGFKNQTVNELAHDVKEIIGNDVKIISTKSDDNRSYHVSSLKIKEILDFEPKLSVKDAVSDLKDAFNRKILIDTFNNEFFFNIKRMNSINLR
tara:strand:- start:846 stop:1823 length:978 start_codon:yes stop_codon:yes gene_type:complete